VAVDHSTYRGEQHQAFRGMAQVQLALDNATIAALRPPPSSRIPEDVVRIVTLLATFIQTVAILATGAWVGYLYLTYQRASNEYALQIAEKQLAQARLGLRQAEQTLKQSAYDLRKSEIELGRIVQTPLVITHQLRVTPVGAVQHGKRLYFASYMYTFTNTANEPVQVSYVIADAFLAHTPAAPSRPIAVNDLTTAEPLRWQRVFQRGFNCRDWQPNTDVTFTDGSVTESALAEHCGAGTGTAKSGETMQGQFGVLVRGHPRDLLLFRVRCAINGGATRTDIKDYAPLVPEQKP
jgi:hypothetical protein